MSGGDLVTCPTHGEVSCHDTVWHHQKSENSLRRTNVPQRTVHFIRQRPIINPLIHADYRGLARRTLCPPFRSSSLKLLSSFSYYIYSGLSRLLADSTVMLVGYPTMVIQSMPRMVLLISLLSLLPTTHGAGDNDDLKINIAPFDGVVANFTSWLISFSAWVAWKKPELMALLNGTNSVEPTPANPNAPTAAEKKKAKTWQLYNTQLYGAIVTHVAAPIQASLHVNSSGDGVSALSHLKTRYGSQSTGDRAEATLRLQRSYIDARAKIAAEDVIRQ